jgi:hypothetical protein
MSSIALEQQFWQANDAGLPLGFAAMALCRQFAFSQGSLF